MIRILLAVLYLFMSGLGYAASDERTSLAGSSHAVVNLLSFGARPNDPTSNSRLPFQQALDTLRRSGGGILSIPAGDYYLAFPDIASDVDPDDTRNAALLKEKNLKREKLILAPPGTMVQGAVDKAGNPSTRMHWRATSFPLLSFVNSDGSGIRDIAFVFDGVQPQFFPWPQENFLEQVGYKGRWLGGPYELSTVIYTIGSSGLRFENISFHSSKMPADNGHTFAFGIVSKGKGPVPQPEANSVNTLSWGTKIPGGGLSDCVSSNVFRSLRFQDYVMGILASGQCSAVFENIEGNYRGSWYRSFDPLHETGPDIKHIGPPGHLIYLTFQNAYDVQGYQDAPAGRAVFHSTTRNRDVTLRNVKEGPETLSNLNSLGTLALKDIEHGLVANVVSQHPAGLIQSMIDAHDVQLDNLSWSSDRDICAELGSRSNCGVPVIALEPGPADSDSQFNSRVQFRNITLQSSRRPAIFKISEESGHLPLSRDISVDGLRIECDPGFESKQESPRGIITLRTVATHLRDIRYTPLIPSDATSHRQNYAALIQSGSSDTTIDITIKRSQSYTGDDALAYQSIIEGQHGPTPSPEMDNKCRILRKLVN